MCIIKCILKNICTYKSAYIWIFCVLWRGSWLWNYWRLLHEGLSKKRRNGAQERSLTAEKRTLREMTTSVLTHWLYFSVCQERFQLAKKKSWNIFARQNKTLQSCEKWLSHWAKIWKNTCFWMGFFVNFQQRQKGKAYAKRCAILLGSLITRDFFGSLLICSFLRISKKNW